METANQPPAASAASPEGTPRRAPRLDRAAIEEIVRSGKRLLVQGAMGICASDGLSGKVAAAKSSRLVGVGTVSAVVKDEPILRREGRRGIDESAGGDRAAQ